MSNIANDGALVRGSIELTINAVLYTLLDYARDGAKSESEVDFGADAKPAGASHAEGLEIITGTIRMRSDKVTPPKWTVFAYDGKNWYIKEREESGGGQGIKQFAVEIWECKTGAVTVT